jgi:4-carboxymuconolactone decarboxylase
MPLSDADRRLLRLFTACVLGRWDVVRELRAAAVSPEPDRRWREAVLQVHVFAGFPRLVEAYGLLAEEGGLGALDHDELCASEDDRDARARGRELFDRIYASDAPAVRAMLERHHPDFAAWIGEHAYGRVLARPGLAADRRELLAVAALAALGQDRQLASHARGSLRVGASAAALHETLEAIADLVEPVRLEQARRVVARFAARADS